MEDITDIDYTQVKRVWKNFKIKNLGLFRDLYVQSDTLLLADVSENFWNICLKICELDPSLHLRQNFGTLKTSIKIQFNYLFCFS